MKIHPAFQDPNTVFVYQVVFDKEPTWGDFRHAAGDVMSILQIELEGERALIKPNITSGERFTNPDSGIITHPGFIHGMVEYFQQEGISSKRLTICDDPRDTDDNRPRNWEQTAYSQLSKVTGVRFHCPTTYSCVKKDVPDPQVRSRLNVDRQAVSPRTVLFNVPKLKTHNLAITTLGMKNLMGLVNVFDRHYCVEAWRDLPVEWQKETRPKAEWMTRDIHERWQLGLARRLVDTAQVIRPALNLVEGLVGREGSGFQRGRNRAVGLVVAGINVVAVDSLASYLMGFDPFQLIYLRLAAEAGLGTNDVHQLQVYTTREGKLILCDQVESLRITPPFQVFSGIRGEDSGLFQVTRAELSPDPSEFQWIYFSSEGKKSWPFK